jgi:hypothetical protein
MEDGAADHLHRVTDGAFGFVQSSHCLERLALPGDFYRASVGGRISDQTMTPVAECAIEMVCRKH